MSEVERAPRVGPWRVEVARFLELVGVFGLAIAQPTFDLLGKNAGLFIAWNATTPRVFLLAVLVILVPPLVAMALELLVGVFVPRLRAWTHLGVLAVGVGIIVMESTKRLTELGPIPLVVLAVLAAIAMALVIVRSTAVRLWFRYLAVAPVGFAALLLFASPATAVVFDSEPAPAQVGVARPARVVMIVMDEFPLTSLLEGNGAIDAQLYPNLAALSQQGTWYRNSTTVAPYTEAAVPAILTGQLPTPGERVPVAAEHPHNLFTLLGGRYHLNVRESVTRLCPRTSCAARNRALGVHPGVRGMVGDTAMIWRDFADPANRDAPGFGGLGGEDVQAMLTANGFINSLQPSTGPTFDFLHVLLPHFPWHYLPTGQDYAALPGHTNGLRGQNWANGQVAALSRVRHLLQAQATDTFIGQVVERLRSIGEWDDTLLVLTADHGVSFAAGGPIRGVTDTNIADIAWTPLLIKAPGQTSGGIDDRPALSIDVVPTIAAHLGVKIPWSVDGRSLLDPARSASEARTFPMFDWSRSELHPTSGSFLHLDREQPWAEVQRARAAPPNEFADLRVFGTGPDDDLLGAPGTGRVGAPVEGSSVVLDGPLRYLNVDPTQPKTPYVAVHGVVDGVRPKTRLAIAVNGVIAGLSFVYRAPSADQPEFWATLVPRMFRPGRNLVQVFAVEGPRGRQTLHQLTPGGARD